MATPSYLENLRLREGADTDVFQSGNLMLLDKNNITRHYIDDYMTVNDIVANNLLEVTTMDLLIEFARIGLGIGCVIKEFVKEPGLQASGSTQTGYTDPQAHGRIFYGRAAAPPRRWIRSSGSAGEQDSRNL